MHNVLNVRPDDSPTKLLQDIAGAKENRYSKLLIHGSLSSPVKALARVSLSYITVVACLAAKERTESVWRQIIRVSVLGVVKIWRQPQSVGCIIEVELGNALFQYDMTNKG